MLLVEVAFQTHQDIVVLYRVSNLSELLRDHAVFEKMSDLGPIVTLRLACSRTTWEQLIGRLLDVALRHIG